MQRAAMVLVLVALAVAGCTTQQAARQHLASGALVAAVQQEPEPRGLDPLLLEGMDAYIYSEVLYSYLTRYEPDGRSVGDLASSVPSVANGGVSADGTRVTFHLRHGVRWQDGTPVTARDVVFTYRAVMNPANDVQERYGFDLVSSCTAPNRYTVVITLRRPFAPIIGFFFGGDSNYPILPAHLLAGLANVNNAAFNAGPVGSGPYRLKEWERGDHLAFSANASYYAGKPKIEQLVLPFIPQDSTVIQELQTGEVDAAFLLDPSRIAELRAIPDHRVIVTPVPWFYALGFNLQNPQLADHAIREALALAIDRRTLTRKITLGVDDADTAMRGLFTWAFDPHADTLAYDPARAAALLTQDGWMPGPGGIRTKGGRRLHFELAFPAGEDITTRLATAIAAAERSVGVDVSLRAYPRVQYIAEDGPIIQGRYQLSLYDYQGSFDPDAAWLLACNQRAPRGFNMSRYCNPGVDALLRRGQASFDRQTRIAVYAEVQRRIAQDLPYFFICQISEVDVIPANLGGYQRPLLSPFNSVASWYWRSSSS
ncbi:MAG TPA: peptide ABC transporter substrate-binding protein [Candidatus Baltobacteraceae bacterium]|nr:peptide ABC transporter substrate-binding protein [Candidatus Baltobacteraceae bacterium]